MFVREYKGKMDDFRCMLDYRWFKIRERNLVLILLLLGVYYKF